jgi:hypothetical protein
MGKAQVLVAFSNIKKVCGNASLFCLLRNSGMLV